MKHLIRSCLAGLCLLLAACGGGEWEPPLRAEAPMQAPALDASSLFDWAESRFPALFPGQESNRMLGPYLYRYYPASGNYVGVAGDAVYVLGPIIGGQLLQVGTLSGFRCVVLPASCAASVSGTAATGAPIADAQVVIKDASGNSVTTRTSATGAFSASTQGLAGPLLLRVTTAAGASLYSVSADSQASTVANITPWTDLIVRSWYGVQAATPDAAFANPQALPPPAPAQAEVVAQELLAMARVAIDAHGAPIAQPLDFISKPFAADGTGIDRFLDHSRVTATAAGSSVVMTMPAATTTLTVSYQPAANAMSLGLLTTNGTATTTAMRAAVVPVSSGQASALAEIGAQFAAIAALVNARGTALSAADLEPYFAADLLDDGMDRSRAIAAVLPMFRMAEGTLSLTVQQLHELDAAAGTAQVRLRIRMSPGGNVASEDVDLRLRRVGPTWQLSGNGRIAEVGVQAEARHNQGAFSQGSGPSINVDVRPPAGTVSAVSVTAPGLGTRQLTRGPVEVVDGGMRLDTFFANSGPITGTLPAAGAPVTVTLTRSGGATVSYALALNAFTTEQIRITSPSASNLAAANLGGALDVSWTLPTTYPVQQVKFGGWVFTDTSGSGGLQCEVEPASFVGAASTSGTLRLPSTCGGQPVRKVNINVSANGFNGERSIVIYTLQ